MKTYFLHLSLFVLLLGLSASDANAAESKMVRTHTGKEVAVIGIAKATCRWTTADGTQKNYVYYGPKGNSRLYAVPQALTDQSTSVEIGYLASNVDYECEVQAMVGGDKSNWLPKTSLRKADKTVNTRVLGVTSNAGYRPVVQPKTNQPKTQTNKQVLQNALKKSQTPLATQNRNQPRIGGMPGQVAGETTMMNKSMTNTVKKADWGRAFWTNTAGAVKSFQVFYWSDTGEKFGVTISDPQASAKSRELTIGALDPNKSYTYRVQAVTVGGKAVWLTEIKPLNY